MGGNENSPKSKRIYWEGPAEEPSASVIETRNRFRNELGDAFRHAQWKAYETYYAWEAKLAAGAENLKRP
jgi:hypothetical protein